MKDENVLAEKYGVKLISMPMMPWISKNEKTICKEVYLKYERSLLCALLSRTRQGKYF
jgi:hypothetical protein